MGQRYIMVKIERPLRRGLPFLMLIWVASAASVARSAEPSAALQLAQQLNQAFTEVAEKATPSVVVVEVIQNPGSSSFYDDEESPFDIFPPELRRYFEEHYGHSKEPMPGEGSGIIIRPDGYILTNGHVVDRADSIRVRLHDGRMFHATLRGVDPQSDVAVIKIEADNLPVAHLGDSSKTKVGEFAIAIGSPYDLEFTVTVGHISAKNRANVIQSERGERLDQDYLQTDALINPGNSGGPLLNLSGDVIGMNTMIRGIHSGIGFAIPSNLVREISDKLISDGKFTRPWLGVQILALRDDPRARDSVKLVNGGVIVSGIVPGGPAAKSELETNDIITAVDGQPVGTPQQRRVGIRAKPIGKPITLDVYRPDQQGGGKALKVPVTLAEWIAPTQKIAPLSHAPDGQNYLTEEGMTVHILTSEIASQFGVEKTNGVLVLAVENGTLAAHQGVQFGDVVTAVNSHPITTPKEFRDALKAGDLKKGVSLDLRRSGKSITEVLKENGE